MMEKSLGERLMQSTAINLSSYYDGRWHRSLCSLVKAPLKQILLSR
jgi:hypothetical protein